MILTSGLYQAMTVLVRSRLPQTQILHNGHPLRGLNLRITISFEGQEAYLSRIAINYAGGQWQTTNIPKKLDWGELIFRLDEIQVQQVPRSADVDITNQDSSEEHMELWVDLRDMFDFDWEWRVYGQLPD